MDSASGSDVGAAKLVVSKHYIWRIGDTWPCSFPSMSPCQCRLDWDVDTKSWLNPEPLIWEGRSWHPCAWISPAGLLASLFHWDSVRLDNLRLAIWQALPCRLSSDTLFAEQVRHATMQWLNPEWSTLCRQTGTESRILPMIESTPYLLKSRIIEYFSERTNSNSNNNDRRRREQETITISHAYANQERNIVDNPCRTTIEK